MAKIKIVDNVHKIIVKDNPADRLEVEVGDEKQPGVFYPQVKIKRWDNEVNASFRLIDDEPKTLVTAGEKIKLIGAKKEVHLYDIAPCERHPKGGFEFEVILKEKPTSNKLEFSIETKGLDFYYQPELTQEEKDKGDFRPENVVGSYAVYHESKSNNEYKTGKAFHWYYPYLIDANGWKVIAEDFVVWVMRDVL